MLYNSGCELHPLWRTIADDQKKTKQDSHRKTR